MTLRRRAWWAAGVVAVGVAVVALLPIRTYLSQRQELSAAERRVQVLSGQNGELAERVQRLNTDAEIERLAREQYSLVRPGEEAFALLPPPEPKPAPRPPPKPKDRSFWSKLAFWD